MSKSLERLLYRTEQKYSSGMAQLYFVVSYALLCAVSGKCRRAELDGNVRQTSRVYRTDESRILTECKGQTHAGYPRASPSFNRPVPLSISLPPFPLPLSMPIFLPFILSSLSVFFSLFPKSS